MTNQPLTDPRPTVAKPKKTKYWLLGTIVLVSAVAFGGGYIYFLFSGARQLEAVVNALDQTDPGWRLSDIEVSRAVYPDEENSVVKIQEAEKLIVGPCWQWAVPEAGDDANYAREVRAVLDESFGKVTLTMQLHDRQTQALRTELERLATAVEKARELEKMPHGRTIINWTPNPIAAGLPHLQPTRDMARLLHYDAWLRAQQRDIDGALFSCRAGLNAGRAIGDEPCLISQLVRIACRTVALRGVEWALGLGEASIAALLKTQRELEKEADEPLFFFAARGERGIADAVMQQIEAGNMTYAQLRGLATTRPGAGYNARDEIDAILTVSAPRVHRAALLRFMTRVIEAAKLPPNEQLPRLKELETDLLKESVLLRMLLPGVFKVNSACLRSMAEFRSAAATLAVERYRLEHHKWPDRLSDLVPSYLSKVPTDPFHGEPLRFRRFDKGVKIYSVGEDGVDNDGALDGPPVGPGTDVGFRLFDVPYRRQPPPSLELPERPAKDNVAK